MLQNQACKRGLLGPFTTLLFYLLSNLHPLPHASSFPLCTHHTFSWSHRTRLAIPNALIPLHILSDSKSQSHLSYPRVQSCSLHILFIQAVSLLLVPWLFCLNSLSPPELFSAVSFAQIVPVLSSSPSSESELPIQIVSPQTTPFSSFLALQSQEWFLDKQLQVSVTRC